MKFFLFTCKIVNFFWLSVHLKSSVFYSKCSICNSCSFFILNKYYILFVLYVLQTFSHSCVMLMVIWLHGSFQNIYEKSYPYLQLFTNLHLSVSMITWQLTYSQGYVFLKSVNVLRNAKIFLIYLFISN